MKYNLDDFIERLTRVIEASSVLSEEEIRDCLATAYAICALPKKRTDEAFKKLQRALEVEKLMS